MGNQSIEASVALVISNVSSMLTRKPSVKHRAPIRRPTPICSRKSENSSLEQNDAKTRGFGISMFSFNLAHGQCHVCEGHRFNRVEMHFLPDVWMPCEACNSTGYGADTLEIRYNGKNIAEVLDMTVDEALEFFRGNASICRTLRMLADVGLGYIQLGQSAPTLSGGEAQRVKLAKELARRTTGSTLYIMDEPTTGLHFDDIQKLLKVLNRLVDAGNTIIAVEHNIDVIKSADWIIDLGPEGSKNGGDSRRHGHPRRCRKSPRIPHRTLPTRSLVGAISESRLSTDNMLCRKAKYGKRKLQRKAYHPSQNPSRLYRRIR